MTKIVLKIKCRDSNPPVLAENLPFFSSITRCKQIRTHKLTSQCNKFSSSLLTIFEGKITQLCPLIKSTTFIAGISNFEIVYFKRYIFKLCGKFFRFIGTLNLTLLSCELFIYKRNSSGTSSVAPGVGHLLLFAHCQN